MDAEILLAFLERYPSPADARGLGVARMQAFLAREGYSGGQHPAALLAKLRSAPRAKIGELELAAHREVFCVASFRIVPGAPRLCTPTRRRRLVIAQHHRPGQRRDGHQ
jgi:hypothetical protein